MKKWKKILILITCILAALFGLGYIGLHYLQSQLESKITGCKLESKSFMKVIDFDYINNWIVVYVKVGSSDKEYPFWFDTGAQTVVLDSLLDDIGKQDYESTSFHNKKDSVSHAFNNELISLHSLDLGGVKFKDIGTLSANNSKWGMLNCVSPYGIIGCNIIKTCVFQINYEKHQITITDDVNELDNFSEIHWVNYKSSINQETPILPAKINDSLTVDLFFDMGYSGGITLSSETLYHSLSQNPKIQTVKYISIPSIQIRGEKNEIGESLILNAAGFDFADYHSDSLKINVDSMAEREFTGLIGNKYFENYIVTLDYRNKRVGFIPNPKKEEPTFSYGLTFKLVENKVLVSSVYKDFDPFISGIQPGDEIYSINDIKISDFDKDVFCKMYRKEYNPGDVADSILNIQIIKGDSIIGYSFNKMKLF